MEHNIDPAKVVQGWLPIGRAPSVWTHKVYIIEKSQVILFSNQYMEMKVVTLRLSGRRGAARLPEHSENVKMAPPL